MSHAPQGPGAAWTSTKGAHLAVIEKSYQPLGGAPAAGTFTGDESTVTPAALLGDRAIQVRCLLPDDAAFDFAVNTMTYEPGASLPMVEMHRDGARPADD